MLLSSNGIAVTSFAAPEVWSALVQVFIIALAVLAGNILRRKVKVLRRSLIPSVLLGGLIILLLKLWADFNGQAFHGNGHLPHTGTGIHRHVTARIKGD